MTPIDIVGTWVHENTVPMGGGVMRIASSWSFATDGTASLVTKSALEHDGQMANQSSSEYAGQWSIASDKLVVELLDHSDSPFQLTLTESGELKSRKRGVWRRPTER